MKKIKFIFLFILIIFLFIYFSYKNSLNKPLNKNGEDFIFVIENGESVNSIAHKLEEANLISSDLFFRFFVKDSKKQTKLQAGEYKINSAMTMKEMLDYFVKGTAISKEKNIQLIEGWNVRDISLYFERQGMFQSEELLELVGYPKIDYRENKELPKPLDYSDDFSFLKDKPSYVGLEGYLFPDTYRVYENASLDEIVRKMLNNFDKKLTKEMRQEIDKQGKSIYEIITMASIIEKEVRSKDDMKLVSGVFWNRIKIGQGLESCATLAYILGVNKEIYSQEDTEIDSLYNTYKYKGLPSGPIANPSIQAIEASIYPTQSDYLYFLSSSIDGKTIFSKTYQEHLINKAKYIK